MNMLDYSLHKAFMITYAVGMVRTLAFMTMLPFFQKGFIESTILKGAIGVSIVLLAIPIIQPQMPTELFQGKGIVLFFAREIMIGIILGYLLGLPFHVANAFGFLVDNQRGSTMDTFFNPASGAEDSELGALFTFIVLGLFFVSGAYQAMVIFFINTYNLIPIDNEGYLDLLLTKPENVQLIIQSFAYYFAFSFFLAAPLILLMFAAELSLALLNKFIPQLNVFVISMPIKSLIATLGLLIYILSFFDHISHFITDIMGGIPI